MSTDIDAAIRAVERLIYTSCLMLDAERFPEYLELAAPDFHYSIEAYSPELRKNMIWLDVDRTGMAALLEAIPTHVRMTGTLKRHASVYSVEFDAAGEKARALTSVLVIHTDPNGESGLMAAGHYHDVVALDGGTPRLSERIVRLETRVFDNESGGSHVPF